MAQMFINGVGVDAQSGRTYDIKNPATGELIDTVPFGEAADAETAVAAAAAAFPGWADTAPDDRANLLRKGIALVEENAREIIGLLTAEQGKPLFARHGVLCRVSQQNSWGAGAGAARHGQAQLRPGF